MTINEFNNKVNDISLTLKSSNDFSITQEKDILILNIKVPFPIKPFKRVNITKNQDHIKSLITSCLSGYSNAIYYHEGSIYLFIESENGFSDEEYSLFFGCKSGLHFPFMHEDRNIFVADDKVYSANVNGGVSIAMGSSVFGKGTLITNIWAKLPIKCIPYNECQEN